MEGWDEGDIDSVSRFVGFYANTLSFFSISFPQSHSESSVSIRATQRKEGRKSQVGELEISFNIFSFLPLPAPRNVALDHSVRYSAQVQIHDAVPTLRSALERQSTHFSDD